MLLRGPWVGRPMPNRADLRSADMLGWLQQNVAAARKILFLQALVFVPSATAAETVMGSYVLPGGLVAQIEEGVEVYAYGNTAATVNNKTINFYVGGLGGTQIITSGAAAANNKPWTLFALVIRNANATCLGIAEMRHNGALVAPNRVAGPTLVNDQSLAVSAVTPTANGDATQDYLQIERLQQWNYTQGS